MNVDAGKDGPPKDREPMPLTEEQVKQAQQDAYALFREQFKGTPLLMFFIDPELSGEKSYNRGMGRNYRVRRIKDAYSTETTIQAFIKRSDHKKGDFWGDEIRMKEPSSLGSGFLFEHVVHKVGGIDRSAAANTDVNRDSGLAAIRALPRIR